MILATGALVALLVSGSRRRGSTTAVVCAATVGGVWVEKGFAFIVGGFIPSALGATPRYVPTIVEGTITAGVYAVGALIAFGLGGYTVATLRREPRG
jgi:molybdopterin-containing oxidoreductase family membrane subunit